MNEVMEMERAVSAVGPEVRDNLPQEHHTYRPRKLRLSGYKLRTISHAAHAV